MPFQRPAPTFGNTWFAGCWHGEPHSVPPTGGDALFLEVSRRDGQLLLLLIDVAGHDLAAAQMVDEIERQVLPNPRCWDLSPEELLIRLNALLQPLVPNLLRFVAAQALRFDGLAGMVEGSSAAQPSPFVGQSGAQWSPWPLPGGPPLGLPFATARYSLGSVPLASGDQLLSFTDGVSEAGQQTATAQQFQHGPFQAFLAGLPPGTSCGQVVNDLIQAVRQHAQAAFPEDDVTVFCVQRP